MNKYSPGSSKLNQRGNVVLALLLVLMLTAFEVYYFFISHASDAAKTQRRHLIHGSVNEVLATANQLLTSPKSLMNSVRGSLNQVDGSLLRCMSDGSYDCPAAGGRFSIYQDDPTLIFADAINADSGLNFAIQPCTGYGSLTDFTCVMKLRLTWTPRCPAVGACNLPGIDVQGVVEVKTSYVERIVLNTSEFKFSKRIR